MSLTLLGACRVLTETADERYCRQLNTFVADTARMRVGQTRQFEAVGFHSNSPDGTSCGASIRGGFRDSTDAPSIADVAPTTGVVTAHVAGTTRLRAVWTLSGVTFGGVLTLAVLP